MPQVADTLEYRPTAWLEKLSPDFDAKGVDGLIPVVSYDRLGMPPEQVAIMEKAAHYGAQFVFFEAPRNKRAPSPQAFIYVSDGKTNDEFAELHRRLWNWGGVPLIYRTEPGLVRLFRCAHKAEFFSGNKLKYNPFQTFHVAATIAEEANKAWWDASRLRNGTLWDDPVICEHFLDSTKSAHRKLVKAVAGLNKKLTTSALLNEGLRRRLLILSLLIAYLEDRGVLKPEYFGERLAGATRFFELLRNGPALLTLFDDLKTWFNGDVFNLSDSEKDVIRSSQDLNAFAGLIEGYEETTGQLNFWKLYSFRDLPVELISEIYQLFVEDARTAVYTPPALVRLILEEVLDAQRMDRLFDRKEVVLDPACGSGVFLVEAYKRLVLHWRSKNEWQPPSTAKLKDIASFVHGVDIEPSAIELTNFSLCLAMCDALQPRDIQESVKLFPELKGNTLHESCFFKATAEKKIPSNVGVVVGNPPFVSELKTAGATQAAVEFSETYGSLPDSQLAYLFLSDAMDLIAKGGMLGMIQQSGFLYNEGSSAFRKRFFETWNVREILDFVSVRGMFDRDTKVVVVVAEASPPNPSARTLHAVFRRNGKADAEQSFEIDYYDLHWISRPYDAGDWVLWRSNLLGGGRVRNFANRLRSFPTLEHFARSRRWAFGEGFIAGSRGLSRPANHIVGKALLPTGALSKYGIDRTAITTVAHTTIQNPKTERHFTPPVLLIKEHEDFYRALWEDSYLTYKDKIVGFAAPAFQVELLRKIDRWLAEEGTALRAYSACTSLSLYTKRATALSSADIYALPYPEDENLDLSPSERIIAEDIVSYQRDLVRVGDKSPALTESGQESLPVFNEIFAAPINAIYADNPLTALPYQSWPGVICQPYVFGNGEIDWTDANSLRGKLDALLKEQRSERLSVTRIARIYAGDFIFLLKPDRLRFWLRSVALQDSDDVLADLRAQGF
jgi:N-6 DNA Methylase